jgi:hypothetical protein
MKGKKGIARSGVTFANVKAINKVPKPPRINKNCFKLKKPISLSAVSTSEGTL